MPKFCVILPAAGSSRRFGESHQKKPFVILKNQAVWLYSAQRFLDRKDVGQIIVTIAAEDEEYFRMKFSANIAVMDLTIVIGGRERVDSVRNALARIKADCDFVAIHDAARPCLQDDWIDAVFEQAIESKAAILATPIVGTVKRADPTNQRIEETVPRERLWQAQTPQVFEKKLLLDAYAQFEQMATDDAEVVEQTGHPVDLVECPNTNLKITTREDLKLAEKILQSRPQKTVLSEFAVKPSRKATSLDDLFG